MCIFIYCLFASRHPAWVISKRPSLRADRRSGGNSPESCHHHDARRQRRQDFFTIPIRASILEIAMPMLSSPLGVANPKPWKPGLAVWGGCLFWVFVWEAGLLCMLGGAKRPGPLSVSRTAASRKGHLNQEKTQASQRPAAM